jgi:hypothetical protein
LEKFGNSVLSPFKNNGRLKLVVVMILIPFVLNTINFWLIDNILKLKTDPNEDELKEIYKEAEENKNDDNPYPQYIQINFENHVDRKDRNFENNQIELKLSNESSDIIKGNSL